MVQGKDGPEDGPANVRAAPARIFADPRKFAEYVLVPGHPTGKDRVFLDVLGFRPGSADDAAELASAYQEQAARRWSAGEVAFSRQNEHGRFYVIVVTVRSVSLRTVWVLRPDGELALATPFRGFAR